MLLNIFQVLHYQESSDYFCFIFAMFHWYTTRRLTFIRIHTLLTTCSHLYKCFREVRQQVQILLISSQVNTQSAAHDPQVENTPGIPPRVLGDKQLFTRDIFFTYNLVVPDILIPINVKQWSTFGTTWKTLFHLSTRRSVVVMKSRCVFWGGISVFSHIP